MRAGAPSILLILSAVCALAACSGSAETGAGTDSASDAMTGTGGTVPATGTDSGTDSDIETESGVESDSETDSGADSGTDSGTETGTDSGDPVPIDCATDPWDLGAELEWKTQWMTTCMVPTIGPILQGIDPTLYADFTCTHCHGEDLGGGSYTMPAATLLDFSMPNTWNPDYFDSNDPMNSPMFEVMTTAAGLLGYEPYNQNNPDSFGCAGCHLTI